MKKITKALGNFSFSAFFKSPYAIIYELMAGMAIFGSIIAYILFFGKQWSFYLIGFFAVIGFFALLNLFFGDHTTWVVIQSFLSFALSAGAAFFIFLAYQDQTSQFLSAFDTLTHQSVKKTVSQTKADSEQSSEIAQLKSHKVKYILTSVEDTTMTGKLKIYNPTNKTQNYQLNFQLLDKNGKQLTETKTVNGKKTTVPLSATMVIQLSAHEHLNKTVTMQTDETVSAQNLNLKLASMAVL